MSKYVYSGNGEYYEDDYFETFEKALVEGKKQFAKNEFIWVGKMIAPTSIKICVEDIIEDIQDRVYDDFEIEDFLDNVNKNDLKKLSERFNTVFREWLKETNNEPNFFDVEDVKIMKMEEYEDE
jgi:hypothetical protein